MTSFQTGIPSSVSNGVQTRGGKQAGGTSTKHDDYFKQIVERTKATIQKKSKMSGLFPNLAAAASEKAAKEQVSTQEDKKASSSSLNFQSLVM